MTSEFVYKLVTILTVVIVLIKLGLLKGKLKRIVIVTSLATVGVLFTAKILISSGMLIITWK